MDNIKRINKILVRLFNTVLKLEEKVLSESSVHNLSIAEMHTLDAIGLEEAKTMSQVAAELRINISTLTTAINKLVKKEYVERFRVPEDRRVVKIALTDLGKSAVIEHEKFHDEMVRNAVVKLSDNEIDNFAASLENINKFIMMQEVPPIKDSGKYNLGAIKLKDYTLPVALFQGGMGIGFSLGNLAGSVASLGGMGVISVAEIGFKKKGYEKDKKAANMEALGEEIKKALSLAKKGEKVGLVGVNIPYSTEDYREYVTKAIEEGAQSIITGAGLPLSLPGIEGVEHTPLIPVISSVRAANIIMKSWQKKHKRLPDAFIFEGAMAGGQLGYKKNTMDMEKENFFKNIVEIKEKIGDIPLIVAGGIFTIEDAKHAYAYGADGIQIGSRFVATKECDCYEKIKEVYVKAKESDVEIISTNTGMPCRVIKNKFSTQEDVKHGNFNLNESLLKAARGDVEDGLIFCGETVCKINSIESVEDVFKDFAT